MSQHLQKIRKLLPSLSNNKHKGQDGRIGIVGGSAEYAGAPYLAGMSALRTGADLVHVFCCKDASLPIKSYSPELIVHGFLEADNVVTLIEPWLERLDVLVIGPGLGRDYAVFQNVIKIINVCRKLSKPLVIDADGLFWVSFQPALVKSYPGVLILTPNCMEFTRLMHAYLSRKIEPQPIASSADVKELATAVGERAFIVVKGREDKIASGLADERQVLKCTTENSGRRCGGQGDLLAGSLAVFAGWALRLREPRLDERESASSAASVESSAAASTMALACYAACILVREANREAYVRRRRGMLASDMLEEISPAFARLYEHEQRNECR